MGLIMGSHNIMGSDYGSNISEINVPLQRIKMMKKYSCNVEHGFFDLMQTLWYQFNWLYVPEGHNSQVEFRCY